jgi:hypothetical protein
LRRVINALSFRVSGSGRRRNSGFITSAKCASTAASIASVLASRPLARGNSRILRGFTRATWQLLLR